MYQPHQNPQNHLLDLQESTGFDSDPKSWLSGAGNDNDDEFSRTLSTLSAAAANAAATGTVDRVLFNDLVEIVPLVQSLIDQKANTSYKRRSSVIYTKAPSRESLYKKTAGRSAIQPTKKNKDQNKNQDGYNEDGSIFSSRSLLSEKDREELMTLRYQVEDLKRQLSEKDELLKSAELSKDEMASMRMKFEELTSEAAGKDSLVKSTQLQLSEMKIKLADKQAAVEKLEWEATSSKKNVERLQEDLQTMEGEISSFMLLIESLTSNDVTLAGGDYDVVPYILDQSHELDYLDELEMQKLEAAKEAYGDALLAAKQNQDQESIAAAAIARSHLQTLLLKQI